MFLVDGDPRLSVRYAHHFGEIVRFALEGIAVGEFPIGKSEQGLDGQNVFDGTFGIEIAFHNLSSKNIRFRRYMIKKCIGLRYFICL